MGLMARVLQVETGDDNEIVQTVEAHYNDSKYCDQFGPSGDDAPPLPEDRVILVEVEGTGNMVSAGVMSQSQGAEPGERKIFSRDGNGSVVACIYLKKDGSVEFEGEAGAELTIKGDVTISVDGDASIDVSGNANLSATKFSVNNGNLEVS